MKKIRIAIVLIVLLQICFTSICHAQVFTTQVSTTQSGGNGSNGTADYSIIAKPTSGEAVIGAEVTGDSWSNMILGSNVSGTRRFWSFSKRTSAETHDLQLLYYNGTTFSNPRLTFATSGHVGINVVTPQVKLDLGNTQNSGLQFRYDESTNYRIRLTPYWNSNSDTRLDFNIERAAGQGFTTVMSVGYNNNVGVGTTTPSQKLEVSGSVLQRAENSALGIDDGTNARMGFIKKAGYWPLIASGNATPIVFAQTSEAGIHTNISSAILTERMRIDVNGKIGIGTATPDQMLTIGGPYMNLKNSNGQEILLGADNNGGIVSTMTNHDLQLRAGGNQTYMTIKTNGNVAIGTTDPKGYKLAVAGKTITEEVVVKLQANWPDYVFSTNYKLPSLTELEHYIKTNKHLPEVPTAEQVKENGLSVGEMNAILLKKVEELTLHLIEQNKKIEEQQKQNEAQNELIKKLLNEK